MPWKRTRTSPGPGSGWARSASRSESAPLKSTSSSARIPRSVPHAILGALELEDRLTELRALVDASTREEFSPAQAISPIAERFRAILEYHLGWRDERLAPLASAAPSGKKLRPALTLLVCEA